MTEQEQIKALAELDGLLMTRIPCSHTYCGMDDCGLEHYPECKPYLTSYDAIIPLIQKQSPEIVNGVVEYFPSLIDAIPSQLCEALLRATGKWKE